MIKHIIIHLSGPICLCLKENLTSGIENGFLYVICKSCRAKTLSPIMAGFHLDKPYPVEKQNNK